MLRTFWSEQSFILSLTLLGWSTQYITEFIKSKGYAGVAYTSTMGTGGTNVAVFDESLFECESVHNVEIREIKYTYDEITLAKSP